MGSDHRADKKQQHKSPTASTSPVEESTRQLHVPSCGGPIPSPLYLPILAGTATPTSSSTPSPIFEQVQVEMAITSKRPRFASGSASSPQWKTLQSPSQLKQQQLGTCDESSPSTTAHRQGTTATAVSSSDTESSHPPHSPVPSQEAATKPDGDQNPSVLLPQFRKGKYVSPVWKPYEMLWLARAWRVQYQGAADAAHHDSQQHTSGSGFVDPPMAQSTRGKTRAEKDKEVAEYLNRHGVTRDAKTAGTKWDNMLGEFRKVYEWERGGEREQFGKSYFRLSPYERKLRRLPASFDEEVFEELSQFMGSRVRTSQVRPGDEARSSSGIQSVRAAPLPQPQSLKDEEDPISSSERTKQVATTAGDVYYEGSGSRGRGGQLGFEGSGDVNVVAGVSSKGLRRIGKIRMTWEECVSLWAEEGEHQRGRVKIQGVSSFLNANELIFLDESTVACSLECFEGGPLKGFSIDKFESGQQVKVFGRRNLSSSPATHAAAPPGPIEKIQLPFPEPTVKSATSPSEYQDPTEYYVGCLRVPPSSLPSLRELSWYLQDPPPEKLRFPLRKDVYRDLPAGKELFFASSSELLDCRGITYEILGSIIRSSPSISASVGCSRDSFIGMWDDCVNRIVSRFCSVELVMLRKPSDDTLAESSQDQWPSLTGFVRNFCLWRGEETDQVREGQRDPSSSLVAKLLWTYNDLPYILGYYAVGFLVTFCALSRSQDRIVRTDLYTFDLSSPAGRMAGLVPCYRVASLLPLLADRCFNNISVNLSKRHFITFSDFERTDYGDGTVREMTPNTTIKFFSNKRRWAAVKEIHDLFDHRIPHAEFVCNSSEKELALVFKPRGVKLKPVNPEQLVEALKCVTKALVALHDLCYMHRDLSWDKVMMRRPGDDREAEWFVCGFDEVAESPQLYPHVPGEALVRHAPEMTRGLHGVKVDVWGVGHLVKTCGLGSSGLPKMLKELQNRCLDSNPEQRPSAADCYHHLLQAQSAIHASPLSETPY